MIIRRAIIKDTPRIHELAKEFDFQIPDTFEACAVVEDDDGIVIAFVVLRAILEAIMVTDKRPRNVAYVTGKLVEEGKQVARELNYDAIHAFVTDRVFCDYLVGYKGFDYIKGTGLVLHVGEEDGKERYLQ